MKTNKILVSAFAMTLAIATISSCSKSSTDDALPAIGGYNSADEVGATDLVAYWPLNGTGIEAKSSTSPSASVGTTWVTGVKGQGANFDAGFLNYPSIAAINNINGSMTISCWAKISNTKLTANGVSTISPLISFTGGNNANIGNLCLMGNTHGLISSDSIQVKAEYHFKQPDNTDFNGDCINMLKQETWMDATHTWNPNKIGGRWAHIVWVWDATTANTRIYVNGVKISNSAWESRNNNVAMPFSFFTPSHPIIGATPTIADGTNVETWNAALKGQLDEIRVWKKLLTAGDINSLYELELAGR